MIKLPINKIWNQNNRSDVLGQLRSSFNLNLFDNEGKTRISPRTLITTNDLTDLETTVAFQTLTDQNAGTQYVWAIGGKHIWRMNVANGYQTAFAKDVATGTPSGADTNTSCAIDESDLIVVGKTYLVLSLQTRMYFYTASTGVWANVQYDTGGTPTVVTLTDGGVHMMCLYGGRVYVVDENLKVRSVSASDLASASASNTLTTSGSYFLNLGNKGWQVTSVSFVESSSNRIWLGTINQQEDGCWIVAWDGNKANDPNEAYYIDDASGMLACVIKDDVPWVIDNNGWLRYFNGGTFVKAPNGRLPVQQSKFLKNSLSSVNDRWIHPNGIGLVEGRINILINNEYEDNGATIEENLPSGVWEYTPDTGWIHKLPLSLYTSSVTDHAQNRVSRVGALYTNKTETTGASANGTMLIGAQLYSDASTTKEVILIDDSNDTLQKYGYLVTSKIYSEQIEDTWQKLYVRHKKLLDASDKIVVKYRTHEVEPTEASCSWTSTTTFTTTTDISDYAIGDEVEVLQGTGGGKCSHITDVTVDAGTYTVTVDEIYTGATGTMKARLQKWKKIGSQTSQDFQVSSFVVGESSPWVQFKVCMQFTGRNEIDDLIVVNKTHQKAE